jgi:hypothetical protein
MISEHLSMIVSLPTLINRSAAFLQDDHPSLTIPAMFHAQVMKLSDSLEKKVEVKADIHHMESALPQRLEELYRSLRYHALFTPHSILLTDGSI